MWKLELDIPYNFQIKPPFEKAQHALDFSPQVSNGVYIDKRAGLAMLMPSTFTPQWRDNLVPVGSINRQANFWTQAARASKSILTPAFLAKSNPANQSPTQIELLILAAIVSLSGNLKWVMESSISLDPDEAFTFYIQSADDEYDREDDYFYLQWDRYGLHVDTRGTARFYRYGQDLQQQPKLLQQWSFTQGGSVVREAAAFTLIPCPPAGYLVIYSVSQPAGALSSAGSAGRTIVSSQFAPLMEYATKTQDFWTLTAASPLRIGVNIRYDPIVAIERVRFPTQGAMTDKPFAVGYVGNSVSHTPLILYSRQQSVQASLKTADGTNAWNGQPDAAMSLTLSTTDARYTPFVFGYFVRIEPEYALRNTTPVEVRLQDLEYTITDTGRDEGTCEVFADAGTNAAAALQRGDTTYRLSFWNGTQWTTIGEGYASTVEIEDVKYGYRSRAFRAKLELRGWWTRLAEVFLHSETAFDGITIPAAIGKLMESAGYPPIPAGDYPSVLQDLRLPSAGEGATGAGWRYAPRVGQNGLEILRSIMLLVNTLTTEYRIRYDFALGRFRFEEKPMPTLPLLLTPHTATGTIPYSELKWQPLPPEANILYVEGATRPDSEGERIATVLVNNTSLTNPNSLDYLGRVRLVRITADALQSEQEIDNFAELVYPHICRWSLSGTLKIPRFIPELLSLPQLLQVQDNAGNTLFTVYARTLTVNAQRSSGGNPAYAGVMTVQFSTQFFTDPREL